MLNMYFSTYPVEPKWHIIAQGVGSENIVYLVANENPNTGIKSCREYACVKACYVLLHVYTSTETIEHLL